MIGVEIGPIYVFRQTICIEIEEIRNHDQSPPYDAIMQLWYTPAAHAVLVRVGSLREFVIATRCTLGWRGARHTVVSERECAKAAWSRNTKCLLAASQVKGRTGGKLVGRYDSEVIID